MRIWSSVRIAIWLLVFGVASPFGFSASNKAFSATTPELPRVYIDTTLPDTSSYTQVTVPAGGDLQAAIDSASCGTVLKLEAGATYGGNFVLRNKGECSGRWIILTSSKADQLPPSGTRVKPSDARFMPRITTSRYHASAVFTTENKANHYRLLGLEIASNNPGLDYLQYDMVVVGYASEIGSMDEYPHHVFFDRTYIHGTPGGTIKRGIALNGNHLAVVDSHISDIHAWGFDSQAIGSWDGLGPFKIVNNYLEGAGENVMFGGAHGIIPYIVMADIEIRGNHIRKPLHWKRDDPSYDGSPWSVKNLFELKKAQRVLVEGNVLENNWPASQRGTAIVLTPRSNEGDSGAGGVVNDVTFRNNIVKNVWSGAGFSVVDDGDPRVPRGTSQANRIAFLNNVWEVWERGFEHLGTWDVTIDHNTVLGDKTAVVIETPWLAQRFTYTNNLALHGYYGIFGSGAGIGTAALTPYIQDYTFRKNAFILDRWDGVDGYMSPDYLATKFPPETYFPTSISAVGFTDYNGGIGGDYTLLSSSPYRNAGTDGKDIGADIPALMHATRGAVSGVWNAEASLSPESQSYGASGGGGTVSVTSFTGGYWSAFSNSSWITITSGASGSGNGKLEYAVAANPGSSSRIGTLSVAGQTFTVTQEGSSGGGGLVSVAPLSIDFGRVRAGETSTQQVQISNKGTGPLSVRGITFISRMLGIFTHEGNCETLAPGESCSLSIKFSPSHHGIMQGIMKIYSNASNPKGNQVRLKGTGY